MLLTASNASGFQHGATAAGCTDQLLTSTDSAWDDASFHTARLHKHGKSNENDLAQLPSPGMPRQHDGAIATTQPVPGDGYGPHPGRVGDGDVNPPAAGGSATTMTQTTQSATAGNGGHFSATALLAATMNNATPAQPAPPANASTEPSTLGQSPPATSAPPAAQLQQHLNQLAEYGSTSSVSGTDAPTPAALAPNSRGSNSGSGAPSYSVGGAGGNGGGGGGLSAQLQNLRQQLLQQQQVETHRRQQQAALLVEQQQQQQQQQFQNHLGSHQALEQYQQLQQQQQHHTHQAHQVLLQQHQQRLQPPPQSHNALQEQRLREQRLEALLFDSDPSGTEMLAALHLAAANANAAHNNPNTNINDSSNSNAAAAHLLPNGGLFAAGMVGGGGPSGGYQLDVSGGGQGNGMGSAMTTGDGWPGAVAATMNLCAEASGDARHQTSSSLYLKNLPPEADELWLYQKFAPYGAILSCKAKADLNTGLCRGVGFVNFAEPSSAMHAMQLLHGSRTSQGRQLHITLQAPRAVRAAAAAAQTAAAVTANAVSQGLLSPRMLLSPALNTAPAAVYLNAFHQADGGMTSSGIGNAVSSGTSNHGGAHQQFVATHSLPAGPAGGMDAAAHASQARAAAVRVNAQVSSLLQERIRAVQEAQAQHQQQQQVLLLQQHLQQQAQMQPAQQQAFLTPAWMPQ